MNMQADVDYEPCAAPEKGVWSKEEHARFLEAIQMYPKGPWRAITEHVGTRSVRQVQTHAQKYQEKVARRERGLQKNRQKVVRTEHRVDEATYEFVHRPRAAKGRRRATPAEPTAQDEQPTQRVMTPSMTLVKATPSASMVKSAPTLTPTQTPTPTLSQTPTPMPTHPTHFSVTPSAALPPQHPQPRPPRIEVVIERQRPSSGPIDTDSLDIRGMMISCSSDEIIREAGDLLDLSPTPSLTDDRQSVPSYTQPDKKKQKLNKIREIPSIDESLDFFIKLMHIWGATCRK